ncbi:MAG: PD40 domain-containing protein [Bacteroidales bacterium]|nr:PD40 domain-containing protein [Bacteroidales bacterium]
MKSTNIKILFAFLVAILLVSCTGKNSDTNTESNDAKVADEQTKELKVWKVPNVIEGAEAYFSPDDKSLIFNGKNVEDDVVHMVYTVNIDGTDLKRINDKGADACSYYHPSGKSLIWTSTRDNLEMHPGNYSDTKDYPQGAELYTSDLDGNNIIRLTHNEYYDAEVAYSPDGNKILFGRQIDGMMDLWIMEPDGSNQTQITHTPDWQEGGAFIMPDNETIIYRAWKKSEQDNPRRSMQIFTIKTDGTDLKQITHEEGTHWAPYPASDGIHFVYVKVLPPHNYEIFMMNLETGKEIQLTFNKAFDGFPTISRDDKTMVFSSSRGAKEGERSLTLYLMDISSLNIGEK